MHICKDKKLMLYRCVDYTKSVGSSEKIAMYRIENHIFHFMFMIFFHSDTKMRSLLTCLILLYLFCNGMV